MSRLAVVLVVLALAGMACGTASPVSTPAPAQATPEPTVQPTVTEIPTVAPPPPTPTEAAAQRAAPLATASATPPPSWSCPVDATGAAVVGNTNSHKFHTPAHARSSKIAPEHRLCFRDRDSAVAAGYEPCGACLP